MDRPPRLTPILIILTIIVLAICLTPRYLIRLRTAILAHEKEAHAPLQNELAPSTPVATLTPSATMAAPAQPDHLAGTGTHNPTDPSATGARYQATIPSASQQQASETDQALQSLSYALRDYRNALGQNPVGSNEEITKALLGNNSHNATFLSEKLPINARGELIDQWGDPYFFHQISANEIDIYSAGPDRQMWTSDDEVVR
ncbi:MAG: type II secretion system protein GspG [Chthoniobacteraceae bacterium]